MSKASHNSEVTLLVEIMMSLLSMQMKLAIILDLIDLSARFMLLMWELVSLMYLLATFLLMDIIICLQEGPLVVILIWGLDLLSLPLIIF